MKTAIKNQMKLIVTIIFGLLTAGLVVFRVLADKIENIEVIYNNIIPICIALGFVLSMIFFKFTKKKFLLTIFLLFLVALAFSLTLLKPENLEYTINYKVGEEEKSVVLALADVLFLIAQLCLVIYTLFIFKGVGLKIVSLGARVAVSVIACFVMKNYFDISLSQILYLVSIANLFCTILFLLFSFKHNWLLFIGVLLLTVAVCLMAFKTGQLEVFAGWENEIVEFLKTNALEEWVFVAGTFMIAVSSAWDKKAER
ncbi:MAG: hypothetical protein K2K31_00045 [Clostridia bacterium]|nr:hypothetical protein [Clostridia bacterium]